MTYSAWVDTHTKFTIHTSHAKGGKARHPHHDYHHDIVNKEILEHELDIPAGDKTWEFSFTLDKETRSTFNGMCILNFKYSILHSLIFQVIMVTQNTLSVLQLTSQDLTSQKMWNSMLTVTGLFDILEIFQ